jgi:hypothetical protein
MKSNIRWIAAVALFCTASVSHAKDPGGTGRFSPGTIPQIQSQPITTSYFRTVYDVETAETLPDVGYRVEYRYLEGYGPPGWHTHSTHYNYQDAQNSLTWVLLHLVADGRIVEFTPPATMLQWERVATFNTLSEAEALAADLAEPDLLTRVKARQVPRFEIQGTSQMRLP